MSSGAPQVVILAGPNGAGKTTAAPFLLRDVLFIGEFVNADTIALGLAGFDPESAAVQASRIMLERIDELTNARVNLAFETTLASRSLAPRVRRWIQCGFQVHLTYISLLSEDLAVARVAERVTRGGHSIPQATIRRRFVRSLRNFFELYTPIVHSWRIYDSSGPGNPHLVADGEQARPNSVPDPIYFETLRRCSHDRCDTDTD